MRHSKPIRHNLELNCYEIDLTQGQVGLISLSSYWVLEEYNFYAAWHPNSNSFRVRYSEDFLHRILMDFPKGMEVDHINNNTLDNRLCNLRIVTKSMNDRNLDDSKSKYGLKGISYDIKDKRFRARILEGKESKSFSVKIYGYDQALQMAKDFIMSKRPQYGYYKY